MKTIAVISGGNTPEHCISMVSAKNILSAVDRNVFMPLWIVASRTHQWFIVPEAQWNELKDVDQARDLKAIMWKPGGVFCNGVSIDIDAAFPIMHGKYGEDGHLQGLLGMLDIPYAGSGVLGSAICMNKHIFKKVMQDYHLPVLPYITCRSLTDYSYEKASTLLGSDYLIVKPSAAGSSYGVKPIRSADCWIEALSDAFQYDQVIVVEPFLQSVRELECAVWLDRDVFSQLGEISIMGEYYSYEDKYINENTVTFNIPAALDRKHVVQMHTLARKACEYSHVKQFARVDFLMDGTGIYLNEINTHPGCTGISLFPKLLELDGYTSKQWVNTMLLDILKV